MRLAITEKPHPSGGASRFFAVTADNRPVLELVEIERSRVEVYSVADGLIGEARFSYEQDCWWFVYRDHRASDYLNANLTRLLRPLAECVLSDLEVQA